MLRHGALDKTQLARAAGGTWAGRGEDRAQIGVLAAVGPGLGADVGDAHRVRLESGLRDYERARKRKGTGLLGAQLAQRIGGPEILLLATRAVQGDLRPFGGTQSGRVARGSGRAAQHAGRHDGVEIMGTRDAQGDRGNREKRTHVGVHFWPFGKRGGPFTPEAVRYFRLSGGIAKAA